jgi:membrane protease YdiL (CAAX protease family)
VWFALLTMAWSVCMAWVYVNTRSLLLPVLVHAGVNTLLGTLGALGTPSSAPGLAPLYVAVNWLAVGVIVALFGRDLGGRKAAARRQASALGEGAR